MTGLLRAFVRLRIRLLVNGLRARRRDSFEQVSRVTRLLVAGIVAASLLPGSIFLASLAFFGARGVALGKFIIMASSPCAPAWIWNAGSSGLMNTTAGA